MTLLGVTFVTFVALDRAPVDRAELQVVQATNSGSFADAAARARAIRQLRVHYGMVDPVTFEPRPLWRRYAAWLGNAVTLRLAGPHEDDAALWRRLRQAVPVTMLFGGLSLLLAFGLGVPFGGLLGRRAGSSLEGVGSAALLGAAAIPEFLLATLLLLAFSVAWLQWLPASGLRSSGADQLAFGWQVVDFLSHLVLPLLVMALGPFVLVARYVRDAVVRAAASPFVASMTALGIEPAFVNRRLLRHGATPAATLVGTLLPMLVGGSIVVENLFALDGLGHLAFAAVDGQDQALVMALLLLTSVVTLLALVVSDLLHRLVDPRVRLAR